MVFKTHSQRFKSNFIGCYSRKNVQVRQAAAYGIGILAKSGPSEANDSLKEFVSALGQLIEGPLGRGDSNPEQIESTENAIRYFITFKSKKYVKHIILVLWQK